MAFLDGQPIPAHHFVCAVLRGDALRFPVAADDAYERELVAICEVHGVQALLQAAAVRKMGSPFLFAFSLA
jgi:hypothetical protein